MTRSLPAIAALLLAIVVLASLTLFTVDQRQNAIVFRLGEAVTVIKQPGLFFKVPLLDNVRFFDTRILTMDSEEPSVSSLRKRRTSWSTPSSSSASSTWSVLHQRGRDEARAKIRLSQTVNDSLRAEFGKRTIHEVVSGERDRIMELMRERVDADARKMAWRCSTCASSGWTCRSR